MKNEKLHLNHKKIVFLNEIRIVDPQSPIPNPQSPIPKFKFKFKFKLKKINFSCIAIHEMYIKILKS